MITIIHGDDSASARTYYKSLQDANTQLLDGEKITRKDIETYFLSDELFATEKSLALENFFSKRKASKEMDEIINVINSFAKENTIILWESKEIGKKAISSLSSAIAKSYMLPKSLFLFLDNIKPNNTKILIQLFHATIQQIEPEMILSMLIRQTRILLALSDNTNTDPIDEVARMQPWQEKKLRTQTKEFSQTTLLSLHSKLFTLEVQSKTGGLSLPLSESIDFLLLSI